MTFNGMLVPTICIVSVLIAISILLLTLGKYGKFLNISLGGKKKKEEDDENQKPDNLLDSDKIVLDKKKYLSLIKNHRFFTIFYLQYLGEMGRKKISFDIYESVADKHRFDSKYMVDFKKTIASYFLCDCVFKYFYDIIKTWIEEMLNECEECEKNHTVPTSYYRIIENIFNFSKFTDTLATNIVMDFKGYKIKGIPEHFVETFNGLVSSKLISIQNTFTTLLHSSTEANWVIKVGEILDFFELILQFLSSYVDASLAMMNGEMKRYLEDFVRNYPIGESIYD